MSKVIILGTDLHGTPTELASKTVLKLKKIIPNHKIISIEHRKPFQKQKDTQIIPKIAKNSRIRRVFQAIVLPLYIIKARAEGYNKLLTFWVANSSYHKFIFQFSKLLGFRITFTIISGKDTNFNSISSCDTIVCQSQEMFERAKKALPKNNIKLILPSINTNQFKPQTKEKLIVIPSMPYDIRDFSDRGIDIILDFIEKSDIKSTLLFRSNESYEFVKKKNLKNVTLINKALTDIELSKILAKAKVIPLIYRKSPDMPLSAIEGLSSGCAIIALESSGLSRIIKENKAGIIIKNPLELGKAIKTLFSNSAYNKNARKTAEKLFSDNNLKEYLSLA